MWKEFNGRPSNTLIVDRSSRTVPSVGSPGACSTTTAIRSGTSPSRETAFGGAKAGTKSWKTKRKVKCSNTPPPEKSRVDAEGGGLFLVLLRLDDELLVHDTA